MSSEYQSLPPATRQAAMSAAEALAPEQSVDEVRESLSVTEKGQPANTIGNCRTVFCHDPLLRDAIRLNLLTDRVDIVRDLGWRRNTSALTDTDVKYTGASVVTAVWTYVGELAFNLLVLVGAIKGCDRIVKEIMGL